MTTGYASGVVCSPSNAGAAMLAYYPSAYSARLYSSSWYYGELVLGSGGWTLVRYKTTQAAPYTRTDYPSLALSVPTFAACDSSGVWADRDAVGWGIITVMVVALALVFLAWCVRR